MELRENEFYTHPCAHRVSGEQKTYKLKKYIITVLLLFFNLKKIHGEKKMYYICIVLCNVGFKDRDMDEKEMILF